MTDASIRCECGHAESQHRHNGRGGCSVCLCWGLPGRDRVPFLEWTPEELRRSIGARRRLLALGYPSARSHQRARETLERMEHALAEHSRATL